jgi:ubiquinone/menaquinone biosynthesis C-methylase UbiE
MKKDFDRWVDEKGPVFFKKIGLMPGQKILDFGCGWGSNTMAAAKAVAPSGCVYALEKDEDSISRLLVSAGSRAIENIRIIGSGEMASMPVGSGELDGVLLYDVIHDHYFDRAGRKKLFMEAGRVIKKKGLLSIFPHHIDKAGLVIIKAEISGAGFIFRDMIRGTILHDSELIIDSVYNFTRE